MYTHLTRRHISALLPLVIRDRLTLYLHGHAPHTSREIEAARKAYAVATGRVQAFHLGESVQP